MSKISLILSRSENVSFRQVWQLELFEKYFNILYIEDNPTIDNRAIFSTSCLNSNRWYQPYIDEGHKLVIDNLWEMPVQVDTGLSLSNRNWFWYNESLWYRYLGYHTYVPAPDVQKNGLLLMNLQKSHRDRLFNQLELSKLLYSYVGRGFQIANDTDRNIITWERYFNPIWYNSTAFSIVAETTVYQFDPLFITEKTFKPIAFQHPFIVYGQSGILNHLKGLGFETFENIFDESYDTIDSKNIRLVHIVNQINNYIYNPIDTLTKNKLKHNKELFFNDALVKERITKEIIEPILEYAEA